MLVQKDTLKSSEYAKLFWGKDLKSSPKALNDTSQSI